MVLDLTVGEHFGTSDHQIVRWNIPIGKEKTSEGSNTFYSFFRANYDIIRKAITEVDLTRKTTDTNVEESWEIKGELNNIVKKYVPKQNRLQKRLPRITRDVIKDKRSKYKAWKKVKALARAEIQEVINLKGSQNKIWGKYIEKRNRANRINKTALASYESRIASNIKCDSKSFFRYVRYKQKVRDRNGPLKNEKGETAESLEETS